MIDVAKTTEKIDNTIRALMELRQTINSSTDSNSPVNLTDSFSKLKSKLYDPSWPEAVKQDLICDPNSEEDKNERSRGILELLIEEDLAGKKFLDYGCGLGHCTKTALEYNPALVVGYDLENQWTPIEGRQIEFTTDFTQATNRGPYDIILIFDVIDHVQQDDPAGLLIKARNLLANDGKIYMRTHPWTSRHATHLYHDINKAYLHLIFTEEELQQLVGHSEHYEPNIGVKYPLAVYESYVKQAGLKILHRRDFKENPEPFFKTPEIAERIIQNTGMDKFPEFQMSLQFIDYVLGK